MPNTQKFQMYTNQTGQSLPTRMQLENYSSIDDLSTERETEVTPNVNSWQMFCGHKRKRQIVTKPKINNSQSALSNLSLIHI